MNLLAVDFGTKRMGLAWAESEINVVLPFGLLTGKNLAEISQKLLKTINTEKPDKIIFGLPKSLTGEEASNTKRVRDFAEQIKEATQVEVEFFDERFSSQLADKFTNSESSRDEVAAMAILSDYLKKNK